MYLYLILTKHAIELHPLKMNQNVLKAQECFI